MTAIACLARKMSIISKETVKVYAAGRCLLRLSSIAEYSPRRGAKTVAPEETIDFEGEEERIAAENERIDKLRNISRLKPHQRNVVNNTVPSEEKVAPWHYTVRYNRRMFGRYGYASGVNPAICWPTKEELADKREYEMVAYPYNILEVAEREAAKKKEEEQRKWERDAEVTANVKTMLKMKEEFLLKKERQKEEAASAKAFRTRLIEEVRMHFNYTVNERDERFKLELKERAKQLREREKNEKKTLKKEKQAAEKAVKFEAEKKKLLEAEAQRAAAKTESDVGK